MSAYRAETEVLREQLRRAEEEKTALEAEIVKLKDTRTFFARVPVIQVFVLAAMLASVVWAGLWLYSAARNTQCKAQAWQRYEDEYVPKIHQLEKERDDLKRQLDAAHDEAK